MNTKQQQEMDLFNSYKEKGKVSDKKKLLTSLKPLIYKQVHRFKGSGLPMTSLKLEGHRLAGQAIDTYDSDKSQLNTHVTNYLKKMSRFVTNYQNVGHIPEPRALMIGKYQTSFENLQAEKGREPTVDELSDNLQISQVEVERLQTELRKDLGLKVEEGDDEGIGGFYQFTDTTGADPRLKQAIEFVYHDSDSTDKKILEHTFGMNNKKVLNAKEIELKLKLTAFELKKRKTRLAREIRTII